MGKFKVRFLHNGVEIGEPPYIMNKVGKMQHFQSTYGTSKMSEIEFEGDDFTMDFEIDALNDTIDWDNQNYPNESVKGKVKEIAYYRDISNKIRVIEGKIQSCRFDDSYKLTSLGKEVVDIINNTKEPEHLLDMHLYKIDAIGNIHYTLDKEVKMISYVKWNASKKKKDDVMDRAIRRLLQDVSMFRTHVEYFKVNPEQ